MAAFDYSWNGVVAPRDGWAIQAAGGVAATPPVPARSKVWPTSRLRMPSSGSVKVCHWRVVR